MRLAVSSLALTFAVALVTLDEHDAAARELAAVDDEPEELDDDVVESEILGPRSHLRTRAEEVSFDARQKTLELVGNVRVDAPPFHLRSQRIRLTRTSLGIELVGRGSLAFCPCLGTPLKVDFDEALVAPPGDLILKHPTLRIYDVPVLPLPYFWLRSDEKLGVLPPDLAYRGKDGVYAGGGVHVPWKVKGERHSLDVRGGAYVLRGFVADVRLRTPSSNLKVRYDRLPSDKGDDGLVLDARGATSSGEVGVAWDADVLRGRRGIAATTELDAAARPWDRAALEAALRGGPFVVSTSVRGVTRRGGGLGEIDAVGPVASLRASGSAGSAVTYDATIEGGTLRVPEIAGSTEPRSSLSFVRGEAGGRAVTTVGALEASLALRGAGDVAVQGQDNGTDRAGSARVRFAAPLARRFRREIDPASPNDANDPWMHVIEPFAEAAVLHARGAGLLGLSPARAGSGVNGTAPIADVGVTTTLGRWGARESLELGGAVGSAFGSLSVASGVRPLARGRAAASLGVLAASAETAHVFGVDAPEARRGYAVVARVRLGRSDGLRLLTNVAVRDGLDPVLARALTDAPLEPASGFLAREGTTGGAGLVIPWSRSVITSVGADGDATSRELVAARAGVELRDRCGCLTLRVLGSHRIGRDGVDVWLSLDFALSTQ